MQSQYFKHSTNISACFTADTQHAPHGVLCSLLNSNVLSLVIYADIKTVASIVEKCTTRIDKVVGHTCTLKKENNILLKHYYLSFTYLIFLWEMRKINFFSLNRVDLDHNLYRQFIVVWIACTCTTDFLKECKQRKNMYTRMP